MKQHMKTHSTLLGECKSKPQWETQSSHHGAMGSAILLECWDAGSISSPQWVKDWHCGSCPELGTSYGSRWSKNKNKKHDEVPPHTIIKKKKKKRKRKEKRKKGKKYWQGVRNCNFCILLASEYTTVQPLCQTSW